jgi:hypothetical protein
VSSFVAGPWGGSRISSIAVIITSASPRASPSVTSSESSGKSIRLIVELPEAMDEELLVQTRSGWLRFSYSDDTAAGNWVVKENNTSWCMVGLGPGHGGRTSRVELYSQHHTGIRPKVLQILVPSQTMEDFEPPSFRVESTGTSLARSAVPLLMLEGAREGEVCTGVGLVTLGRYGLQADVTR